MTKPKAEAPASFPFRYVGPYEAVIIVLPSGRTPTVERCAEFEALPAEVAALLAIPTEWEPLFPVTEPPAAAEADPKE